MIKPFDADRVTDAIRDNLINGNLSDAADQLARLNGLQAALVTIKLLGAYQISGIGDTLRRILERRVS